MRNVGLEQSFGRAQREENPLKEENPLCPVSSLWQNYTGVGRLEQPRQQALRLPPPPPLFLVPGVGPLPASCCVCLAAVTTVRFWPFPSTQGDEEQAVLSKAMLSGEGLELCCAPEPLAAVCSGTGTPRRSAASSEDCVNPFSGDKPHGWKIPLHLLRDGNALHTS